MHAVFNNSGNGELTWEVLGGCDETEYCNLKTNKCTPGEYHLKCN